MSVAPVDEMSAVELARLVALRRASEETRSELEGRRRSRAWFRSIGHPIPPGLRVEGDVLSLVESHGEYWLRSAETLAKVLDPRGLGAGDVHVLDAAVAGETRALGFYLPGYFDAVRHLLEATARPGPVAWVGLIRHVAAIADLDALAEDEIRETVRVSVAATALHEFAHAIDEEISGDVSPPVVSLEVLRQFHRGDDRPTWCRHSARWARALSHLASRASRSRNGERIVADVDESIRRGTGIAGQLVREALADELESDEAIRDIVSRAPTARFGALFPAEDAASG